MTYYSVKQVSRESQVDWSVDYPLKESGIREIKDNVCDFVANNGPLVVMGAAAATSFILKKMFG